MKWLMLVTIPFVLILTAAGCPSRPSGALNTRNMTGHQILHYDPAVVVLSGKIEKGKFQHPNGEWVDFLVLKLGKTASIEASGVDPENVAETGIQEIQLYSDNEEVYRKLEKFPGKNATVKGTLFHGHTAWHVRPLVMDVIGVIEVK